MSAQMIFVRSTSRIVPFNFDAGFMVQARFSYESAEYEYDPVSAVTRFRVQSKNIHHPATHRRATRNDRDTRGKPGWRSRFGQKEP